MPTSRGAQSANFGGAGFGGCWCCDVFAANDMWTGILMGHNSPFCMGCVTASWEYLRGWFGWSACKVGAIFFREASNSLLRWVGPVEDIGLFLLSGIRVVVAFPVRNGARFFGVGRVCRSSLDRSSRFCGSSMRAFFAGHRLGMGIGWDGTSCCRRSW